MGLGPWQWGSAVVPNLSGGLAGDLVSGERLEYIFGQTTCPLGKTDQVAQVALRSFTSIAHSLSLWTFVT